MINKERTNDMIVDNLLRADSALQVSMDGKPEASLVDSIQPRRRQQVPPRSSRYYGHEHDRIEARADQKSGAFPQRRTKLCW